MRCTTPPVLFFDLAALPRWGILQAVCRFPLFHRNSGNTPSRGPPTRDRRFFAIPRWVSIIASATDEFRARVRWLRPRRRVLICSSGSPVRGSRSDFLRFVMTGRCIHHWHSCESYRTQQCRGLSPRGYPPIRNLTWST